MNIHPNLLAAIGAAQIGHMSPGVIRSSRHDNSNEVTDGMCKYTKELLDALASLLVANVQNQVVAVALQMGSPAVLTIAENGRVKPELLRHLQKMLTLLQCMADEYAKLDNWNGPPTEIPPGVQQYRNKLIQSVYRYSVDKILNRFTIGWARLQSDLQLCYESGNATKLGKARERFEHVLCSLEYVQTFLGKIKAGRIPVVDDEWARLIGEMDLTIHYLASRNHSIAEIFHGTKSAARCVQALKKMSSQHQHIQILTKIAHAVRVDPNIRFNMVVRESTVISPVPVHLPQTIEELQPIIGFIIQQQNRPSNHPAAGNNDISARDIFKRFPQTPYGNVHCECALITHLDSLNQFQFPPCNYIGVSKLSCAPCDVWIHAFNTSPGPGARPRTYHTMGTHSKWYPKWAMPPRSSDRSAYLEIQPILLKKLALGFASRKSHCGSDSTIAKGDSDRTSLAANPDDLLSQDGIDEGCESETSLNSLSWDVR